MYLDTKVVRKYGRIICNWSSRLTASLLVTVPVGLAEAQAPTNVKYPSEFYTIDRVKLNPPASLSSPTAMTFYGDTIWVTEVGNSNATPPVPPAVKQIDNLGNVTTQLTAAQLPAGTLDSPLTGIIFARDWFWLVHRQKNSDGVDVGVVSRFKASDPVKTFETVIAGFPSFGDHPNSQIVIP
jgi:hypothetical protein